MLAEPPAGGITPPASTSPTTMTAMTPSPDDAAEAGTSTSTAPSTTTLRLREIDDTHFDEESEEGSAGWPTHRKLKNFFVRKRSSSQKSSSTRNLLVSNDEGIFFSDEGANTEINNGDDESKTTSFSISEIE